MASKFSLPFIKKEKIAKNTFSFYFDKSKNPFDFQPGEYLRMTLDIKNPDARGSSRYFTIAASPLEKEIIITTKIIKSSFKKELLNLKKGQEVSFFGPMGNFVIDKNDKKAQVFLAGGIGITTFYSMIKYLYKKSKNIKITLIVSFSNEDQLIYKEELDEISRKNSNIKINYTLTRPIQKKWKGEIGRIDADKIKKLIDNYLDSKYYIVGPDEMVEEIKGVVKSLNISEESVNAENFEGY